MIHSEPGIDRCLLASAAIRLASTANSLPDAPQQLGQTRTGADGGFTLSSTAPTGAATLYLIAKGGQPQANAQGGDNPAIALMTVIGRNAPATVTINEMTTVASVWTHAQFLNGTAIKGPSLSLRIAAGNVPNFVDLQTGGWGTTIQDPLNSGQTPTMANFATLAYALAGCVTRVTPDACPKLYTAATPPKGDAPNDTLMAAQSIARYPWYLPERLFALLGQLYPIPPGKNMRAVPFMPYLSFAPSACRTAAGVALSKSTLSHPATVLAQGPHPTSELGRARSNKVSVDSGSMSEVGQSRRFAPLPATSGLPQSTDIARAVRLVRFAPILLQKSAYRRRGTAGCIF